jgi:hypothetical protein
VENAVPSIVMVIPANESKSLPSESLRLTMPVRFPVSAPPLLLVLLPEVGLIEFEQPLVDSEIMNRRQMQTKD